MRVHRSIALATLFVALAGCAYHRLGGGGDARFDEPLPVSFSTLANDTSEPGVELLVSEALRRELLRAAGGVSLVEDPDRAQFDLRGRVSSIETSSRSFSTSVRAVEFSVSLTLDLELVGRHGRRVPLESSAWTEREVYLASLDVEVSRKNREEALRRLAVLLATRVRDALEIMADEGAGHEAG